MSDTEEIIWTDRPSQLTNIIWYLTLFWTIIVPLIVYLRTRFTIFVLTNERIKLKKGVLSQIIDEVELYRVRDYLVSKPLFLRIFGLGNLCLITSDKTHREVYFRAIRNVENVASMVRANVEVVRRTTNTREIDYT